MVGPEKNIHEPLKRGRCPIQPEWKHPVMPVSAGGAKAWRCTWLFTDGLEAHPLCALGIHGDVVELVEVVAEAESAILLRYHYFWAGQWAPGRLDDS